MSTQRQRNLRSLRYAAGLLAATLSSVFNGPRRRACDRLSFLSPRMLLSHSRSSPANWAKHAPNWLHSRRHATRCVVPTTRRHLDNLPVCTPCT